jgi:hypothetical protein
MLGDLFMINCLSLHVVGSVLAGLELNQLLHDRQQSSLASSQLTPAVGTVPSPSDTVPSDGLASGSSTLEGTVHRDASQGTSRPVNKTVDGVDPHWVAGHHTMTLRHLLLGFPDPHLERRYQLVRKVFCSTTVCKCWQLCASGHLLFASLAINPLLLHCTSGVAW